MLWPSLETYSNLFTSGSPNQHWHLVVAIESHLWSLQAGGMHPTEMLSCCFSVFEHCAIIPIPKTMQWLVCLILHEVKPHVYTLLPTKITKWAIKRKPTRFLLLPVDICTSTKYLRKRICVVFGCLIAFHVGQLALFYVLGHIETFWVSSKGMLTPWWPEIKHQKVSSQMLANIASLFPGIRLHSIWLCLYCKWGFY